MKKRRKKNIWLYLDLFVVFVVFVVSSDCLKEEHEEEEKENSHLGLPLFPSSRSSWSSWFHLPAIYKLCLLFKSAKSASVMIRTSSLNDLRLPAEFRLGLGWIADQQIHFRRAEITRVNFDELLPVQA